MKKYIVPELEVKNFEVEDVIMTSSNLESIYNDSNVTDADTNVVDDISYSTLFSL